MRVERGEILGLEGPSGSGKSTLPHLMAPLDVPTAGEVTIKGNQTSALSSKGHARLRRESVGMIFQRFHLWPSLSARGNVTLPMVEADSISAEEEVRVIDQLLD
ncbi:MAG: ATP-binding cassette domain-containing protein [Halodesulfurarchaeum sp.]